MTSRITSQPPIAETEPRAVYIVDDEAGIRSELAEFFENKGYSVMCFASGDDLIKVADNLLPGCVILDLQMPGRDGLSVLNQLAQNSVQHSIIILTGHGDVGSAVNAMSGGAVDYVEKPFAGKVLCAAVDVAFERLAQSLAKVAAAKASRDLLASLSARERHILIEVMTGKPSKLVAHELGLSIRTVESYRSKVMAKLGVRTLAGALAIAREGGMRPAGVNCLA